MEIAPITPFGQGTLQEKPLQTAKPSRREQRVNTPTTLAFEDF